MIKVKVSYTLKPANTILKSIHTKLGYMKMVLEQISWVVSANISQNHYLVCHITGMFTDGIKLLNYSVQYFCKTFFCGIAGKNKSFQTCMDLGLKSSLHIKQEE